MKVAEATVRWMICNDMPAISDIERACFPGDPWTDDEFAQCLRRRNCIGMVAERHERIVGFMVYELLKSQLHVLNFAVPPWAARQGVGSQLAAKLIAKLSQQRRTEIVLEVRETNLAAQLFWKSQEFLATDLIRNHYESTDEDAYQFTYVLPEPCQAESFRPQARFAR